MQSISRPFSASFCPDVVPAGYTVRTEGVFAAGNEGSAPARISTTACWISGKLRDTEGNHWSARIHMLTEDGVEKVILVPFDQLTSSSITQVIQTLAQNGMLFPVGDKQFRQYLNASACLPNLPRLTSLRQLGFFEQRRDGESPRLGFVLPNEVMLATSQKGDLAQAEEWVFQPAADSASLHAYRASGTLSEWQQLVGPLADYSLHVFAVCAAVAGPFLAVVHLENGGVNLFGQSSTGKTTALQLAASVWGNGADPQRAGHKERLIERWNSTPNAMEPVIAAHSGMMLCFDELGSSQDPNIYNIIGGTGKSRMREDGTRRESYRWTIFVLSTGEESVQMKIESVAKRKARTGELMRMIDVPVDELARDSESSQEEMRVIIDRAKAGCATTFGTAGPEFIRQILDSFETLESLRTALAEDLDATYDAWCEEAQARGIRISEPQGRALRRLALVSTIGVWASDVLGFTPEQVTTAVEAVRDAWLSGASSRPLGEQAVEALTEYVLRYKDWLENDDLLAEEGDRHKVISPRGIISKGRLLLASHQLEEALDGLPRPSAVKELHRAGVLIKHSENQYNPQCHLRGSGIKARFYAFHLDKLAFSFDDEDTSLGEE